MIQIVEWVDSPQYKNFFKEFDRKLSKNVLKRCIVEPFSERIMRKVPRMNEEEVGVEQSEI